MEAVAEKAFGCVGSTIRLTSGKYLDLLKPDPSLITLADIHGPLSKICRFGGQCKRFYSVAEHSVACAKVAERQRLSVKVRLACLMHDAAEAFIGDVVKPLKVLLEPIYGPIEQGIENAIATAFDIDFESTKAEWKRIDRAMLIAERRMLFESDSVKWTGEDEVEPLDFHPEYLRPVAAETAFIKEYIAITSGQVL